MCFFIPIFDIFISYQGKICTFLKFQTPFAKQIYNYRGEIFVYMCNLGSFHVPVITLSLKSPSFLDQRIQKLSFRADPKPYKKVRYCL
jgi:hypothetical protein